jgi:hemerythrin
MALVWKEAVHGTGVKEIDLQHQELFRRVNAFLQASVSGKGQEELVSILHFLQEYVVYHFNCEEKEMDARRCAACEKNRLAHQQFLKNFAELRKSFVKDGPSPTLLVDVQQWVVDWLDSHVAKIDTELRKTSPPAASA